MSIIDLKDTVIEVSAKGNYFDLSDFYFVSEPAMRIKGRTIVDAYLIRSDYEHHGDDYGRSDNIDLTDRNWRFICQPIEEDKQVKPIGLVMTCETCRCLVDDEQKHIDWHLNLRAI